MEHFTKQRIEEIKTKLNSFDNAGEAREYLMQVIGMEKFIRERQNVKIGHVPIHCEIYENRKDDPVIIFVPGIGTYSELYCEFFYKLSKQGFNVIGFDPRGHGYSGGRRGLYTVEQTQKDISEVIDYCVKMFNSKIALFGCSLGSPLALAAAEYDDRVKALLCHTLFLSEYPFDLLTWVGWNSLTVANLFVPDFTVDFRSYIDIDFLARENALKDFIEYDDVMVWNYPIKTLSSVYNRKCKVLKEKFGFKAAILLGERDELIKREYEENIIENMKHPFELIIVPGGKHMLQWDHVRDTITIVKSWFNKVF